MTGRHHQQKQRPDSGSIAIVGSRAVDASLITSRLPTKIGLFALNAIDVRGLTVGGRDPPVRRPDNFDGRRSSRYFRSEQ